MAYDLTGKIKVIQEPQTFASGFTKREFVVTVEDGKYPQEIALECVQDKVKLLEEFKEGQTVTVSFDIRGREYNGRYFNNLQGWKVALVGEEPAHDDRGEAPPFPSPEDFGDDDIPF